MRLTGETLPVTTKEADALHASCAGDRARVVVDSDAITDQVTCKRADGKVETVTLPGQGARIAGYLWSANGRVLVITAQEDG